MSSFSQSIAWWCFVGKTNPEALISESARIGYGGVEMCPRELWGKVQDAGLKIATEGGHKSLTDGLNKLANHDRIQSEIEDNLEIAVKWRVPCLIVFSGNRNGISEEEGLANTVLGLSRVSKQAEQAGVTLVMELLNSKVDHADYQCDRTPWGVEACKQVNSPAVKLLYDIYHMQIMEGDVIRTIRDNHQYFGHYHTAGNPGRNDLDTTQELYYPAIAKAIHETGYTGFVGQEFMPKGEPFAALEHAYKACLIS